MSALAPWLAPAWNMLSSAIESGRVHHALLLAGAAGTGKRALAGAFAAALLCEARGPDGHACDRCRACLLTAAGSHPDRVTIGLETRDDGKLRAEIRVEQIRALRERLALSSQFGGWQVAMLDPADLLNVAAANALLKTLEEPASATVLVLVADQPARLPATIRSRCQRITMPVPDAAEALAWLKAQGVEDAAAALEAALGNPGRALAWNADGSLALQADVARELAALSRGRANALQVALRWDGEQAAQRLWLAAAFALAEAQRLARGEPALSGLTGRAQIPKLADWFGRANRARGLLTTTLRSELVLLDLLRAWPVTGGAGG